MGAYDCDCINNLEYDRRERKQKEQPQSTVSTTQSTVRSTDLIDRGQVIDVIEDYPHGNVWNVESMEEMVDKIKTLPTVQPVATDTNVGDTISRQAAIDVLSLGKEMLSRVLDDMDVVGTDREKYSWGLGLIESYINDIKELPTAQPEPQWIPCEDCERRCKRWGNLKTLQE